MTPVSDDILPAEIRLALAHTPRDYREALTIFFDFDLRLGRILSGTTEPMLGQMRLAWWRETLMRPAKERPTGDIVLDAIGKHWVGRETALIALVDCWEELLAEPPLGKEHARRFAQGRSRAMLAAFDHQGRVEDASFAAVPAELWAIADLANSVSEPEEREMLVTAGLSSAHRVQRLSAPYKGVALLGALALRSLEKGGRPLMEGRGASITALRAAIFGR